jgi:hypothetical protein
MNKYSFCYDEEEKKYKFIFKCPKCGKINTYYFGDYAETDYLLCVKCAESYVLVLFNEIEAEKVGWLSANN